jgi:UDP:flavonoid glycosyltransferase YjiC (YdhE family)
VRLAVFAFGGLGHITPVVALIQAATEAGHEVRVLTDLDGVAVFDHFGVPSVGIDHAGPDDEGHAWERLRTDASTPAAGHDISHFLVRGRRALPAVIEELRAFEADVLLREVAGWGAMVAAEVCGIPVATYEWTPPPTTLVAAALGPQIDEVRKRFELPLDPECSQLDRWLRLVLAPPWWARGNEHLPPTAHWIRPVQPPTQLGVLPAWLDERREAPLVYATLGTVFNRTGGLLAAVLDGLATLDDVQVIATTGNDVDPAEFSGLPDRIRVERFVPQAAVLEQVDAVVAHGGYGTLMGALAAGRPAVAIPLAAADNVANAQSVSARGAGLVVRDYERAPEVIAERTRRVLDEPAFSAAAWEAASEIAALPGPDHAIALLARLAEGRAPVRR